jgi:hypothetical protein
MKKYLSIFLVFVAVLIIVGIVDYSTPVAKADGDISIVGWAWSSNTGWISFNSINANAGGTIPYGITMAQNGDWSGYAWSDNIGWINMSPLGPYPETPNEGVKLNGSNLTGWARACAVYVSGCSGTTIATSSTSLGGWDGWIKMAGNVSGGGTYSISKVINSNQFTGYAWGDDILGWVHFSDVYNSATYTPVPSSGGSGGGGSGAVTCTGVCTYEASIQCGLNEELVSGSCSCVTGYVRESGICVLATLPSPSYDLFASPTTIKLNYTTPGSQSDKTEISATPYNGFAENITLTIVNNRATGASGNLICGGDTIDCHFITPSGVDVNYISEANGVTMAYNQKTKFYIVAKKKIAGTRYNITIKGRSTSGIEATTQTTSDIILNLQLTNPTYSPI